ncbi:DegV family protein [Mycoplasmatota bacterium WC44]
MKKVGIINTSTSCLDYIDHGYKLKTARMQVIIEDETYVDYIDINAQDFFKKIEENKDLMPSTSTPNYVDFENLIKEYEEEGYDEVLILTISSGLSAAYGVAKNVADEYEGKMNVQAYDTRTSAIVEGYICLEALKLASEGQSLEEIIPALDKLRENNHILFVVDSLRLLIKNGRLSNASGFIGTALKIKPMLHVNEEGKILTLAKVRTSKKAINSMIEQFFTEVEGIENFDVIFITSNNPEMEKHIEERVFEKYPNVNFITSPLTPVVGCHTAEKIVGLGYFKR